MGDNYLPSGNTTMRCSMKMRLRRYMLTGILVPFKNAETGMIA